MDQQLKARLIGGAVLVTLIVLLVPELLSGRKASEPESVVAAGARSTRTFTIELGNGGPASVTPQAAPVAKPETQAKPEPEPPPEATPSPQPVPAAQPAVSAPAPTTKPAVTTKGGWAVQVGAFGSAESARKLVKDLAGAGFDAYVAPIPRAGKTLHRVRVGPVADRAEADRLAARLKARRLPATVVAND